MNQKKPKHSRTWDFLPPLVIREMQFEFGFPDDNNTVTLWYCDSFNKQLLINPLCNTLKCSDIMTNWLLWLYATFAIPQQCHNIRLSLKNLCFLNLNFSSSHTASTRGSTGWCRKTQNWRSCARRASTWRPSRRTYWNWGEEITSILQGDPSGQRLYYVDFDFGVPICCLHGMPILPDLQLPKQINADIGTTK